MKILQLCKKFPYPLLDGESLACTYLAQAFYRLGAEVSLLSMNTSKHWFDLNLLPPDFNHYQAVHTVFVDNRIRPLPAFFNLFTNKSFHIQRFEHQGFAEKLTELLQSEAYDVVQIESVYLAPYIPVIRKHAPQALLALRAHNVEFEIWERVADDSHFFKKLYLNTITPRLKKYEIARLNDYDAVIGIAQRDVDRFQALGLKKPAHLTPIGLDVKAYKPDYSSYEQPLSLSFIGSLDWMPNVDGLRWFLDEVWKPLLAPRFPELTFHIAGRNTPDWLKRLKLDRVKVYGEVPNAAEFLNKHSVSVAPLLSGGGMRAKILEALALGKVALSTPLGMEGIPARHAQEALLATTPQEFADCIQWCVSQGPALATLGRKAQAFCTSNFDNIEIGTRLLETYSRLKNKVLVS